MTGQTVNFTITVRNIGASSATGIKLSDLMPEGLAAENLEQTFDLKAVESRVFEISAKVTSDISGIIRNTASLEWQNQNLRASASVRIEVPVQPVPIKIQPAKLKLEKFADRMSAQPGDVVNYTLKVSNTGGSPAQNIKLEDVLPTGLEGTEFYANF